MCNPSLNAETIVLPITRKSSVLTIVAFPSWNVQLVTGLIAIYSSGYFLFRYSVSLFRKSIMFPLYIIYILQFTVYEVINLFLKVITIEYSVAHCTRL